MLTKLKPKTSYPTQEIAILLNKVVATSVDFYFLYKGYHWNLQNTKHFYNFHLLFDKHAKTIYESIDVVAERIRQMGERTESSIVFYTQSSQLAFSKESDYTVSDLNTNLSNLVTAHDKMIQLLEEGIKLSDEIEDNSTNDMLIAMLQEHQQMRWFIMSSVDV